MQQTLYYSNKLILFKKKKHSKIPKTTENTIWRYNCLTPWGERKEKPFNPLPKPLTSLDQMTPKLTMTESSLKSNKLKTFPPQNKQLSLQPLDAYAN